MYFGNVSDFFFKNKDWLLKQPKFGMNQMGNKNIVKIGNKLYKINDITGALEIIKNEPNIKKDKTFYNNKKRFNSENKKLEILPEINDKNLDFTSQNIKKSENRLHSLENPLVSIFEETKKNNFAIDYLKTDSEDEEYNKANEFDLKSRLNNYRNKANKTISGPSFRYSHFNSHQNKKFSLFLNTSSCFAKSDINHTYNKEKDRIFVKNRTLNFNNNKIKIKKNIPIKFNLLSEFNDTSEKNIYAYNDKNNYIKNMETIPTNKDFKKNLTENELIKRMFPNEESLKVKESDNKVIANIKNQVYEIKLYDDLRKKYNFYNVKSKSCNKKISKIKIKNIVNLFNDGYKQNSGSLHRKLYFKHINRQKKNDDVFLGLNEIN